jgi:hypothetical protein
MRLIFILLLSPLFFSFFTYAQPAKTIVNISFVNKAGDRLLQLDTTYTNPFGEEFTVKKLKYYISNISFINSKDEEKKLIPSYYLIDESNAETKSFTVNVAKDNYKKICFFIGVDSIKNVSGTQTDALDPMNGMFWTWNSGYINAKLEATSPVAKTPTRLVEYHIGGFRINQNTVRKITLPLSSAAFNFSEKNNFHIIVEADINKWFKGVHDLKISANAVCTTPGNLAVQFADNYAEMFKIANSN